MENSWFRPHPITILYMMRSFGFVYVAPFVRMFVQYIISGTADDVLLLELVVFCGILMFVSAGWYSTKIRVFSGFITIKRGVCVKTFKKISVQSLASICINRNLLDLIFNSATCRMNLKTDKLEKHGISIKIKARDIKFFCNTNQKNQIYPLKTVRNRNRFFYLPTIVAILLFVFAGISLAVLNQPQYCIVLVAVAIVADLCYGFFCYYNFNNGQIGLGEMIVAIGARGFITYRLCFSKKDIGIIKIYQTPTDRRLETCKVKFVECGEGAKGAKVSNAEIEKVLVRINKAFDLNIEV